MAQQNETELLRMLEEVLSAEKKDAVRILEHFHECRNLGIDILPLDVNQSETACVFEREQVLRLGFSALGYHDEQFLVELLNERRKDGAFQSFQDFCERIDTGRLPEAFLPQSIKAGAFDSLGESRARLLNGFGLIVQAVQKEKADKEANQISLFAMMPAASQEKALSVKLPNVEAWNEEARIEHEKEALGFSFTEYLMQLEDTAQENAEEPEPIAETADTESSAEPEKDESLPIESPKAESEGSEQDETASPDSVPDEGVEPEVDLSMAPPEESDVSPDAEEPNPIDEADEAELSSEPPKAEPEESEQEETASVDSVPDDGVEPEVEISMTPPEENDAAPAPENEMPAYLEEAPFPEEDWSPEASAEEASVMEVSDEVPSSPAADETSSVGEDESIPTLWLRFQLKNTTEAKLLNLRELCQQHQGTCPLLLEFIDEGGKSLKIQAHQKYSVRDTNELRQEIQALFEDSAVFLDSALPD